MCKSKTSITARHPKQIEALNFYELGVTYKVQTVQIQVKRRVKKFAIQTKYKVSENPFEFLLFLKIRTRITIEV